MLKCSSPQLITSVRVQTENDSAFLKGLAAESLIMHAPVIIRTTQIELFFWRGCYKDGEVDMERLEMSVMRGT